MSWSFKFIGKASNISKKIEEYSTTLTGSSKDEFNKVKPNIQELVNCNYNNDSKFEPELEVSANGHAWHSTDGSQGNSTCNIEIKNMGAGVLV